jgi:hypothetical protein
VLFEFMGLAMFVRGGVVLEAPSRPRPLRKIRHHH